VTFDAAAYKTSTREQWQTAAAAWHRWGPQLEDWLGEATELMLDLAGVRPGSRVLDIAAGAGGQTLAAARRAGPEGAVLATDISPAILEFAAAEARRAGLGNVTTSEQDAERLNVHPRSFDAAISRPKRSARSKHSRTCSRCEASSCSQWGIPPTTSAPASRAATIRS